MRTATRRALILSLMLAASPAAAQSVSEQGAKDLQASLAGYIGQGAFDSGVVSVKAGGDSYEVTIDLPKLVANMKPAEEKAEVTVEPFVFHTTPKSDGTWTVKVDDFPGFKAVQKKETGEESMELVVDGYTFEGTYDPKIAAFTDGEGELAKISFQSRTPEVDTSVEYGHTTATLKSVAAADGAVNSQIEETIASLTETITGKGATQFNAVVKTGEIKVDAEIEAAKQTSLMQLLAFFAANPSKDKVVAAQSDLKSRLTAALPLWNGLKGTVAVADVSVETPIGPFKAASFSQTFGLSGLNKEGYYDLGIKIAGLTVPDGIIPAWTKPVLPQNLDISARLSGPDMDAVSRLAIDNLTVGAPEPWSEEVSEKLQAMFMNGPLKLTINPGSIGSPSLTLNLEGGASLMPQPPEAQATITADGFDKAMADLQTSTDQDPNKQQALMMLGMAKGLSKPGDGGKALWKIELLKDGSVSVNGQQLKPPTAQQQ